MPYSFLIPKGWINLIKRPRLDWVHLAVNLKLLRKIKYIYIYTHTHKERENILNIVAKILFILAG